MTDVLKEFARSHPEAVVELGDIFVRADVAIELIDQAERRGIGILGLEGFLIDDEDIYPSLDRIADFSSLGDASEFVTKSAARARELLNGPWRLPPGPANQMHSEATGRHMIVVCFAD